MVILHVNMEVSSHTRNKKENKKEKTISQEWKYKDSGNI